LEFRFRVAIILVLYLIGFNPLWVRTATRFSANSSRLWSWLALRLAETNLLSLGNAYLAVTVVAVALATAGALLRIWGTAYLGHSIMRNPAMQSGTVIASGPYRHLRNPLYLGMLLTSCAVAVLMPTAGALVFIPAMLIFTLRLIGAEEAFLTGELGDTYLKYRNSVPSIVPRMNSQMPASTAKPRWLQGLTAEVFPAGTAICFAALAWSYDADLLARSILVCFGLHLIARAIFRPASDAS
jgi:protein-S-isoprenylcysteine O-methyltransferase Ste14